jgi:hypothetical protein
MLYEFDADIPELLISPFSIYREGRQIVELLVPSKFLQEISLDEKLTKYVRGGG